MNRQEIFTTENTEGTEKIQRGWGFGLRVVVKAAALFVLLNVAFAVARPMEAIGRVSLYNILLLGRERLPYGENPAQSYSLSLNNIPAMFASHVISRAKADDEFRVLLMGDSSTWGWRLENQDTLAGQITAGDYRTADGRRVVAYNLGYPIMSLLKDVLLLDEAMQYQPDMILWLVTLESFPRDKQTFPPIVQNNGARVSRLMGEPSPSNLVAMGEIQTDFMSETIVGRRRDLADWLRLQLYGFSWMATGIDQYIPAEYTPRQSDFEPDVSWQGYETPTEQVDLAFDVLDVGVQLVGEVPLVVINEPMFISDGQNSDLRYNAFYPRWVYDLYREQLAAYAESNGFDYRDWWDRVAPDAFTDSPVHLTVAGSAQVAAWVAEEIRQVIYQ